MQADPLERSAGPLLLLWSALWRAQVVHLGLIVLLPGVAALARALLGVVLLPFLLTGEGDRSVALGGEAGHLAEAGCWVALLPCSFAERTLYQPRATSARVPQAGADPSAVAREPFMPAPTSFTVRHAWFAAWLLWFLAYLVLRERRRGKT